MGEWQPIETAPKDGTRCLFYTPADDSEGGTGYLAFMAVSRIASGEDSPESYYVPQWEDGLEPTHWMPLPEPPNVPEQEQCSYCQEWYPKPVNLHHSADECDLNVNERSATAGEC